MDGTSSVSEAVYYAHPDYPGQIRIAAHSNGDNGDFDIGVGHDHDQYCPDIFCDDIDQIPATIEVVLAWAKTRCLCFECSEIVLKSDAKIHPEFADEWICKDCQ